MPTKEARTRQYECDTPEWKREYYATNRERILNMQKEKRDCVYCGRCVTHGQMTRHLKSKYCMKRRTAMTDKHLRFANECNKGMEVQKDDPEALDKLRDVLDNMKTILSS